MILHTMRHPFLRNNLAQMWTIHWTRQNNSQPVLGPGTAGKFDDLAVLHPAVVRDSSGLLRMWYNGIKTGDPILL